MKEKMKKILICCGPSCLSKHSMEIYEELKRQIREINSNVEVETMVKATGCHGLCQRGPLLRIEPEGIFYCDVQISDVDDIIQKTLIKGEIIDKLLYHEESLNKKVISQIDTDFYKGQVKIALRNVGEIDPNSIEDYIEHGGYRALEKALTRMTPAEVINEIEKSGLRGRGGAGYPTGRKWRQCSYMTDSPKYVICNGDEGDPGAFMDRCILEGDPHSVIEAMVIAGYAIGSHVGFMYIRDEYFLAIKNVENALYQAKDRGLLGENILGTGFDFDIQIVRGGGAFVCGESTALMTSIEGKVGEPRAKYIRSVEKGLWGKPTVLNNVETFANIPPIIIRGADWFCGIGTEKSKGTKVFSLVGKVKNTGLIEVPMGVSLREIISDIGGGIEGNRKFKAIQTGGPSGGCIPESMLDLPVDFDSLDQAGSIMGSGGMIVMDERTCMVDVARYYLRFLSEESCGQCVPCREGIKRMLEILDDICNGKGQEQDLQMLKNIAETIHEASLCGLGKSAPNPVLTTVKYFKEEYLAHINEKRCPAGVCKALTTFFIDLDACRSCGLCAKNCPSGAIKKQQPMTIDQTKCIKCGQCLEVCRFAAVTVKGGVACR